MKTWNRERKKTRDRLLDYELPPMPFNVIPPMVYPWNNLAEQLNSYFYTLAQNEGFKGTSEELWQLLLKDSIYLGTYETFPEIGEQGVLYIDKNTRIVYIYEYSLTNETRVGYAQVGYSMLGKILHDNYAIVYALGLAAE